MSNYDSYKKNGDQFSHPKGSGAPTPCPASKKPAPVTRNLNIALQDDFGGGGIGYVTLGEPVVDPGQGTGAEYAPCNSPFQTTGLAKDFTWVLKTSPGGAVVTPSIADTKCGGLLNLYTVTCADIGSPTYEVHATGRAGTDFSSFQVVIADPLGLCP